MVDLKSLFKHLLFSFVSLLLVSCSFEWFEDAETVFNKGLTTPITFYADNEVDEPKVVKEYVLGNFVEASKFPSSSDFEELKSKNGYKLDGYKWMSCTEASIIDKTVLKPEEENSIVPDCVKIDEKTGLVSSIKITGEICYFYGIWSLRNDIPYSVSHMLQDAENTDEYKLDKTEKFVGTAFAVTDVKPLEYEGFDHLEIDQEEINPDGKTVVTVYYNRKKVTVKIYDSEDPASGYKSVTGLYGQKIDVKQPDIPNYFFVSWYYYDNAGNRINVEKIETLPSEDRIYYGSWLQESSGGSIVNPLNSKITFKASDISQVHAGDVIRITAVLNDSAEVKLTDWDYALYFMNAEEIDITSSVVNNESYIELTVGSVAAGSYTLYVSGVYNGVAQDGMFTFVVQ